jgi:hypothetical protein
VTTAATLSPVGCVKWKVAVTASLTMSLWLLQGLQFMPEVLAGSNSRKSFVVEPTVGTSTEKLIFEPGEVLVSRPFAS